MHAGVIDVDYRFRDGWHCFTSRQLKGLYVANQDAEVAYSDVGNAISKLLSLNERISVYVEPAEEFGDFLRAVRRGGKPAQASAKSGQYVVHTERRCA